MFRVKTIVLTVCGVLSVASCMSLGERAGLPNQGQPGEYRGLEPEAMYRLGRYYQGQTRYVEAVQAYREALRLNPRLADAHNGLGVSYAEQGRYSEAVEALRTAVELDPNAAHLHSNLGYALLLIGSDEEALHALDHAQSLDPSNEKVLSNLRLAQQRLGRIYEQRSVAETATAMNALGQIDARIAAVTIDGPAVQSSPDIKLAAVSVSVYELQNSKYVPVAWAQQSHAIGSSARVPNAEVPQATEPKGDLTVLQKPQVAAQTFGLEVSNGNGVRGLAKRVARFLDRQGIETRRITNHKGFGQRTTVVQFRPGYSFEANEVRAMLSPEHVPIVQSDTLRSDIHVRVLLGKDLPSETALLPRDKLNIAAQH